MGPGPFNAAVLRSCSDASTVTSCSFFNARPAVAPVRKDSTYRREIESSAVYLCAIFLKTQIHKEIYLSTSCLDVNEAAAEDVFSFFLLHGGRGAFTDCRSALN